MTNQAQAAKAIREILKKEFPNIKFKVTSSGFAGGDSVNVRYTDGVPVKQVEAKINQFRYGHFDGMQDLYEYSNKRDDIPQTKYLTVDRELSDEARKAIIKHTMEKFGMDEWTEEGVQRIFHRWPDQVIYQQSIDLTL